MRRTGPNFFFGGDEFNASTIQTIDPADPNDGQERADEHLDSIDFVSEVQVLNNGTLT